MTWDYIAGFIDGEGSIVKRKRVYNLLISQTQFEVLEEIRKFIGCGLVHALGRRKSHWKDAWLYNAGGGKNTYYILENVANKLIVKRDLAIRVLHELKLRLQETEEIKKSQEGSDQKGKNIETNEMVIQKNSKRT